MKSLHNNILNQIKEYNSRLEEKNDIARDFEDHIEQLHLEKAEIEEDRLKLLEEVKLLKERVNKEMEQLDKKMIHESDSNRSGMSDLSNKSDDNDESENLSQYTVK